MEIVHGAINKKTGEYTLPIHAIKEDIFICPECREELILKQGKIRIFHFSHKKNSNCTYFTHPTESQIHKDAKLKFKMMIEKKMNTEFKRQCCICDATTIFHLPEINENSNIIIEYRFPYQNSFKVADVAWVEHNKIKFIFEIYHSHQTKEMDRPEPWFEIEASVIHKINVDDQYISIPCIRNTECETCKEINITIPFGKFKNKTVREIEINDPKYLQYLSGYDIPNFDREERKWSIDDKYRNDIDNIVSYYTSSSTQIEKGFPNKEYETKVRKEYMNMEISKSSWWELFEKSTYEEKSKWIEKYKNEFNRIQELVGYRDHYMWNLWLKNHYPNIIDVTRRYIERKDLCKYCFKVKDHMERKNKYPFHSYCYFKIKNND